MRHIQATFIIHLMFHPPIIWLLEGVPVAVVVSGTTQWHSSLPTGVMSPRLASPRLASCPVLFALREEEGGREEEGLSARRQQGVTASIRVSAEMSRKTTASGDSPGNSLSVRLLPSLDAFLGLLSCSAGPLLQDAWSCVQCKAGGGPRFDLI